MTHLPDKMADSQIFQCINLLIARLDDDPIWMTMDQKYRGLALDPNDEAVVRLSLTLMAQTLDRMRQDAFDTCDVQGTC